MKKKLFFIILLLIPVMVFAKETYNYEWEKYNVSGIAFIDEEDNQYQVFEMNNNGRSRLTNYQPNGKRISSQYLSNETIDDMLLAAKVFKKIGITKMAGNVIGDRFYRYMPGQNLIGVYNIDTGEEIDEYYYDELSEEDQIKYTGDYHLLFELMASEDDDTHFDYIIKKNCYLVYKYVYNERTDETETYLELYNKNEERVLRKKLDYASTLYAADLTLNGMYVVEASYNHIDAKATYNLIKYDLNGKEISRQDITEEIQQGMLEEEVYYSLPMSLDIVNDGVILGFGENAFNKGVQLCIDYYTNPDSHEQGGGAAAGATVSDEILEECLTPRVEAEELVATYKFKGATGSGMNSLLTTNLKLFNFDGLKSPKRYGFDLPQILIKLSVEYEIATKVEGQGEIKAITKSGAGSGVTFEVAPKPGYVLSVVKVTDAAGNVITFTDYTFTMPSSDVLIEAVFVPSNPNTKDIAIISVLLLAIGFGLFMIFGTKKTKWLR